jgi:amidase
MGVAVKKDKGFKLEEAAILDMARAMEAGEITSRELVLMYLQRIAEYDRGGPGINSVLEINPDAVYIAEAMDRERALAGPRGPLHGIPVLIKDNINTRDKMHTSAGSLALKDSYAPYDAFIVKRLRKAGAVILGKANMTEFANFMTENMPSGYSSRGGQVLNPYGDFTPGGSSSGPGAATACNFCAAAVGTETSGSILSPSNQNMIAGIKPTVGLVSRTGIIPIANSQDTAGPMARTVSDAAILLGALTGEDEDDPATLSSKGRAYSDYRRFLNKGGLQGARIGVPRKYFWDELSEDEKAIMEEAIETIKGQGAEVVDPIDIESAGQLENLNVLIYEFKPAMNAYLSSLGSDAPMRTLSQIIEYNDAHSEETLKYGQIILKKSDETSGTLTDPIYINDRLNDLRLSRTEGIDRVMKEQNLDALIFPGPMGSDIAARAGYPSVLVPAGLTSKGEPLGVAFTAGAYSEPALIKFAYAYEQASKKRVQPKL